MEKPMKNLRFRIMAAEFWFRYRSSLPKEAIAEAAVVPGDTVLDFGCGPGGFAVEAARVAGPGGMVYALDIMPLAARYVKRYAKKAGVANVQTITSGLETALADRSVDVVLLYDIFHHLPRPDAILTELARVLKDTGRLSVSDHHLDEGEIVAGITKSGHFRFMEKGRRTITFMKARE